MVEFTKYVEAPNKYESNLYTIFLAGGITNCPDWQKEAVKLLKDELPKMPFKIILNPRRENFPIHDPKAALEQITWEYHALNQANLITFWFAKETIQPIVLFELGRFVNSEKDYLIGIHPDYPRKQDVEIQTRLARPDFKFAYSLKEHIWQIIHFIEDWEVYAI
jgi:hypothetical protein